MRGEVIAMILEGIIATTVMAFNLFMVIVILRFRILRQDVSLSLLLYLLISEGLFAGMMVAACVYQIIIYQTGLDTKIVPQSWCLRTIFPPLMIWANLFIPYCDALIGLEKLLFVVAPSFYQTLNSRHVHRFMFCLVIVVTITSICFIIHWSNVNDFMTTMVFSSSAYPNVVRATFSTNNLVVLTTGAICYIPVILQIRKFVYEAHAKQNTQNGRFYASFALAVKWTGLIILATVICNLIPEWCRWLNLDIYSGYEFYVYVLFAAKPIFNTFVVGLGNRDLRKKIRSLISGILPRSKTSTISY